MADRSRPARTRPSVDRVFAWEWMLAMSDVAPEAQESPRPLASPHAARLRERFETAWTEALGGAAPPRLEQYLDGVPDSVRAELRRELERLEQSYRPRYRSAAGAAAEIGGGS